VDRVDAVELASQVFDELEHEYRGNDSALRDADSSGTYNSGMDFAASRRRILLTRRRPRF